MNYKWLKLQEVQKLLDKYGLNELKAKNTNPWWKILFNQFTDILVLILIAASVITAFEWQVTDTIVIVFIVLLNWFIWFFQEFKSEKTLKALQNMVHPEVRVIRDEKEQLLDVKYLVPGDIVLLWEWDKLPADGKLLESHMLQVSEAALTWESVPVKKKDEDKVFMWTSISKWSWVMLVEKTWSKTEIWRIAKMAVETKNVLSPLQKELSWIWKFVAILTLIICAIIFVVLYLRGWGFFDVFMYAVSIAISAVPEWLPTTITIALAMWATVLAKKHVIVKKMSSVETLWAVTTICSDKTWTLTRNEMTVREVYTADSKVFEITWPWYNPNRWKFEWKLDKTYEEKIIDISVKCNEAKLIEENNIYSILWDPTEWALLTMAEKIKKDSTKVEKELDEIFPFDSDRKMMSVASNWTILAKGSPDSILEKSKYILENWEVRELTEKDKEKIREHYSKMADKAYRVLAYAYREYKEIPKDEKESEKDLIFVALVWMIDPPRSEVKDAVLSAKKAWVRVIVITWDYGPTASAIAKELNIIEEWRENYLFTWKDLKDLSDDDLKNILKEKKSLIFARSMPADKMRIVSILQELWEIVSMTWDWVNDAPALKKADIWIAMWITWTEVSKESANMILMNDSFASIVKAIEEWRRIYQNLKKFIWYMFSSNTWELVAVSATIIFFIPNILTAILILCINLWTDILPAISMWVWPADRDNMNKAPRDSKSRILEKSFITSFLFIWFLIWVCVVAIFIITLIWDWWTYDMKADFKNTAHAMTAAFAGLVFIQMVNTFSAISPKVSIFKTNYLKNKFHLLAVLSSVIMVLLFVYVPFFNEILGTTPLTWKDLLIISFFCFVPTIFMETKKIFGKIH